MNLLLKRAHSGGQSLKTLETLSLSLDLFLELDRTFSSQLNMEHTGTHKRPDNHQDVLRLATSIATSPPSSRSSASSSSDPSSSSSVNSSSDLSSSSAKSKVKSSSNAKSKVKSFVDLVAMGWENRDWVRQKLMKEEEDANDEVDDEFAYLLDDGGMFNEL